MGKDTLKELLGYHNFAKDCPKAQKALKGAGRSNEKPNRRRGGGSGGAGGSARQLAFIAGDVNRDRSWIMDSGATSHVTYDASELSQVQRLPRAEEFEIMGVCGQVLRPTAKGTLTIRSNVQPDLELTFKDVYVDANAVVKVIAVHRIDECGGMVSFGRSQFQVRCGAELVLKGERDGRLYKVPSGLTVRPRAAAGQAASAMSSPHSGTAAGRGVSPGKTRDTVSPGKTRDTASPRETRDVASPSKTRDACGASAGNSRTTAAGPTRMAGPESGRESQDFPAAGSSTTGARGDRPEHVSSASLAEAVLWHRRYGHLGFQNLELIVRSRLVCGLESLTSAAIRSAANGVCQTCKMAKSTRKPHFATGHRARGPLDLIHADVSGLMSVTSFGGARYVLVCLDDYTGYSAVCFMKTKAEVRHKLVELIKRLERWTDRKVRVTNGPRERIPG